MYDPQLGRWFSIDPLAEDYASLTPYNYVGNSPLIFVDPDGTSIEEPNDITTRYVDPTGRTIINTNDGRNDIFVVPRYMLHDFLISAGAAKTTGESNSTEWNDRWRSKCEFLVGEQLVNQFHSESAIFNLTKYLLTLDDSYFLKMLLSELGGQWTDPELVVSGLLTGINGLYFMNNLGSTGRILPANEIEAAAMQRIKAAPSKGTLIERMQPLKDKRWTGWRKMYYEYMSKEGKTEQIHFNAKIGKSGKILNRDDFKFK